MWLFCWKANWPSQILYEFWLLFIVGHLHLCVVLLCVCRCSVCEKILLLRKTMSGHVGFITDTIFAEGWELSPVATNGICLYVPTHIHIPTHTPAWVHQRCDCEPATCLDSISTCHLINRWLHGRFMPATHLLCSCCSRRTLTTDSNEFDQGRESEFVFEFVFTRTIYITPNTTCKIVIFYLYWI